MHVRFIISRRPLSVLSFQHSPASIVCESSVFSSKKLRRCSKICCIKDRVDGQCRDDIIRHLLQPCPMDVICSSAVQLLQVDGKDGPRRSDLLEVQIRRCFCRKPLKSLRWPCVNRDFCPHRLLLYQTLLTGKPALLCLDASYRRCFTSSPAYSLRKGLPRRYEDIGSQLRQ